MVAVLHHIARSSARCYGLACSLRCLLLALHISIALIYNIFFSPRPLLPPAVGPHDVRSDLSAVAASAPLYREHRRAPLQHSILSNCTSGLEGAPAFWPTLCCRLADPDCPALAVSCKWAKAPPVQSSWRRGVFEWHRQLSERPHAGAYFLHPPIGLFRSSRPPRDLSYVPARAGSGVRRWWSWQQTGTRN